MGPNRHIKVLLATSSDNLCHYSQNVDQKWKAAKSEVVFTGIEGFLTPHFVVWGAICPKINRCPELTIIDVHAKFEKNRSTYADRRVFTRKSLRTRRTRDEAKSIVSPELSGGYNKPPTAPLK